MDIKRAGSQSSSKGPADYFTGTVGVDPLFQADDAARDCEIVAWQIRAAEAAARTSDHRRGHEGAALRGRSVSVAFEEVDANDWADRVYQPDIVRQADTLYKKPGYTM